MQPRLGARRRRVQERFGRGRGRRHGWQHLATEHWGRMFVRVQTPAPVPARGVLHGDLFEARGPFGDSNMNQVRWGIVENTVGSFQWIYNVQRSTDEFGTGTEYVYQWDAEWFCMEWHHDQVAQEATLWFDGVEVEAITQTAATTPEIPVFTSRTARDGFGRPRCTSGHVS